MTDLAAALYPSMPSAAPVAAPAPAAPPIASPAPQVAAVPAQAQESAPAASVDADRWTRVPEAIQAERKADTARRMFDNTQDLQKVVNAGDFPDMPPEAAQALASSIHEMARDIGASHFDVAMIRNELDRALQAPLTPEQRAASQDSAIEMLNAKYGNDATRVLNQTREWIAADPRRAQLLQAVGDTPSVVMRMVELARAAKSARR
jgi:precorrin isomerase